MMNLFFMNTPPNHSIEYCAVAEKTSSGEQFTNAPNFYTITYYGKESRDTKVPA